MSKNTTVPAALANDPEIEVKAFLDYLGSKDGKFQQECLSQDADDLRDYADLAAFASSLNVGEGADAIIHHAMQAMDHSEGAAMASRHAYDGYLDRLGVRRALLSASKALRKEDTPEMRQALRRGLNLCYGSRERMPDELLAALVAIGMPEKYRGRVVATYDVAAATLHKLWLAS